MITDIPVNSYVRIKRYGEYEYAIIREVSPLSENPNDKYLLELLAKQPATPFIDFIDAKWGKGEELLRKKTK
jgi:hypothetical protein